MKLFTKVERGLKSISTGLAMIAAIVLAAMMLLTVVDVVGRYFFNHPIKGTWELVGLLLVCAGTWGLGYCQMEKAHISITILLERFSKRAKLMINIMATFLGLVGFSLISWQTFLLAKKYFLLSRGNVTDTLGLPYSPFMLSLSIGAGTMALMLLANLIRSLAEVRRK